MTASTSNLLYVWTANGTMTSLSFPMDLAQESIKPAANPMDKQANPMDKQANPMDKQANPMDKQANPMDKPKTQAKTTHSVPDYAIEPFIDNFRRTVSNTSQYSEIPYNNIISTRQLKERIPMFKFQVEPNKNYKLNVLIRAKIQYRYNVPILAKYTIESNSPQSFMNYRATYVSSHEVNTGTEQDSNVLGSVLNMVVDSKLSLIRLTATFQTNAVVGFDGIEIAIYHGLKTDDPEATLYGLDGSYAVLSELTGI